MGLDMYMHTRRRYVNNAERKIDLDSVQDIYSVCGDDRFGCSNIVSVREQVCYWRKANMIHRWFVNNVQNGIDECQDTYVGVEKVKELYGVCKGILEAAHGTTMAIDKKYANESYAKDYKKSFKFNAKDLNKMFEENLRLYSFKNAKLTKKCNAELPTAEGFFFGATEIDGAYLWHIVKTYLMLKELLKKCRKWDKEKADYDIFYSSSW